MHHATARCGICVSAGESHRDSIIAFISCDDDDDDSYNDSDVAGEFVWQVLTTSS